MGPVMEIWVLLGKCGFCQGNVGPVRKMWVLLWSHILNWEPNFHVGAIFYMCETHFTCRSHILHDGATFYMVEPHFT